MNLSLEKFGVDLQIENDFDNKSIYSIGYERKTLEEFFLILKNNDIKQLIDVRNFPNSKKKMFSTEELRESSKKYHVEYHSMRELGSPQGLREKLEKNKNLKKYFQEYSACILFSS